MNLSLAIKKTFEGNEVSIYTLEDGSPVMTVDDLAKSLDYADRSGVQKIVNRNEYLKNIEFSTEDNLSLVEGGRKVEREVRIFNEDGIYEVTMLSSKPKAKEFRAFVRKTLKSLRKGEAILIQPQTEQDKLKMQMMRAEAMLNNSRTRQAKLILDMQKNKTLSPVAIELLQINALEMIMDKPIDHRPEVEKTYDATEIGLALGVSAQKIGRVANNNEMKTAEYGIFVLNKSRHSSKQVESFRYNENGRAKLKELFGGLNDEPTV